MFLDQWRPTEYAENCLKSENTTHYTTALYAVYTKGSQNRYYTRAN
jgi:hypothetical protein